MGNIVSSDGIKSGYKIDRQCITCGNQFETWSDDTITIKGPMPPQMRCPKCNDELLKVLNPFDFSGMGK